MWYRNEEGNWFNFDFVSRVIIIPVDYSNSDDEDYTIVLINHKGNNITIEEDIESEESAQMFIDLMMKKLLNNKNCSCDEIEKELGWQRY